MRRTLLIVLLSVSTVVGFASGCASLVHHARKCGPFERQRFEDHVAGVCVKAARRAAAEAPSSDSSSAAARAVKAAERAEKAAERASRAAELIAKRASTAPTQGPRP